VRRQREDHGIARRANAILLLDAGKSCARIAKFLYLDDDTIRGWHKTYLQGGWDALAFDGWKGGQSRMSQAREAWVVRLAGSVFLSLYGRDQGPCRG